VEISQTMVKTAIHFKSPVSLGFYVTCGFRRVKGNLFQRYTRNPFEEML